MNVSVWKRSGGSVWLSVYAIVCTHYAIDATTGKTTFVQYTLFTRRKGNVTKPLRLALGPASSPNTAAPKSDSDDGDDSLGNSGTMIVDEACAPSNMKHRIPAIRRKCGLITAKLKETICHSIAISILALNFQDDSIRGLGLAPFLYCCHRRSAAGKAAGGLTV